jgi:outer membrane protein assembly factor BamA
MKNKFIQLSALLLLFFTTQAFTNPINKINFIGLNNTSEKTLLSLIPFEAGQIFSPYVSDQNIESLFKTELFENISIVKNEKSLDITLKENPTIKYFEIKLNTGSGFSSWLKNEKMLLTNEILNEQVAENQLSAGNTFTKRKLDKFVKILETKYLGAKGNVQKKRAKAGQKVIIT